jgi:acetyl esterase/lipase
VLGFSAGGHLASTVAVLGDDLSSPDDDLRGAHSARPDAVVLCYPVIDLGGRWAHAGSRVALLGDVTDDVAAPSAPSTP